jgi:hypothetical protein
MIEVPSRDSLSLTRLVTVTLRPMDDHEPSEGEAHEEQAHKETLGDEGMVGHDTEYMAGIGGASGEKVQQPAKKRERKEPLILVREVGKSLLPFARVQKIIKADKVCTARELHEIT